MRDGVFEADVFWVALPAAEPLVFVEAAVGAPLRVAVFAVLGVAGPDAAELRTVDALRPADLAGAVGLALPRLMARLPAGVRAGAFRVEAAFAGARLVAAVFADAVFADAVVDAVLLDAGFLDGVVDAVVDARLLDARAADVPFAGALRAVEDLLAVDLPPVPVVLPVVVLVDAFLAAGLLAPVFLLADLRGLVVAMHLSRGLVAPPGGPLSISPAACREGDRKNARRAAVSRTTARTTPARMPAPPAAPAAA